jgi:hypothetical protein
MADYFGTDTFTYVASDGSGFSNTATVTITVNSVNDAPVAVDDDYIVDQNSILTVSAPGVLANDTDTDGDTLTAVLDADPVHGAVALSTDGGFVYIPVRGYSGPDAFTYMANDGSLDSNVATVNILVTPVKTGGGGGGCFIATAAWGSEHWRTNRLRAFRDSYLLPNMVGQWLVNQYYRYSPGPAGWLQDRPWAQMTVSFLLERLLWPLFL